MFAAVATVFQCLDVPQAAMAQEAQPEEIAIIRHLSAAITWYKQLRAANDSAGHPSDTYYLDNARDLAKQAVELAFQSAEAEAALLPTGKGSETSSTDQQNLAKTASDAAALSKQTQAQIDLLNSRIPQASGKKHQDLISQRDTLQAQLDFDKALQDGVQKLSTFVSGSARNAGGLQKEIDDLKNSVPELFAKGPSKGASSAPSSPPSNPSQRSGLMSQVVSLFSSFGDLREIDQLIDGTGRVSEMASHLRSPLRDKVRAMIAQGYDLANYTTPQNLATMEEDRAKITALTAQFKQISKATVPLAQEIVLLGEIQVNLRQWEVSVHRGYLRTLESVLIRISILLMGIGIVMGLSELWRRATFRYVREARRQRQFLLIRRIVTGFLMAMVLILGFVNEFGSLATFAGFITAGLAVALQTLILSIAAYFFLIGRQGLKVGDRITVSGVTGDVVDVGLIRFYLMELGGTGSDLHPTGRVIVVSNSVLLQGGPFFKQIPGTAYAWHEVAVKLERGSNYTLAENKLLEAVNSVFSQFREDIEQQHKNLEGWTAFSAVVPAPQARLQLVESSLDLVVRYPVVLHRESEIDNQMARKVMEAINSDPDLKAAVGLPTIRPSVKP
jgi:small-conductance mechanosensitive channel